MRKPLLISVLIFGMFVSTSAYAISSSRVVEIQQALNKHGYSVRVTGVMDARTVAALKKYQKDNKFQHKVVPDARALIQLGLGPKYKNLLNPETAWIAYTNPKLVAVQ